MGPPKALRSENQLLVDGLQAAVDVKLNAVHQLPRATTDELKKAKNEARFAIMALQRALSVIADFPEEIKDADQLKGIKNVGPGTIKRVKDILENGFEAVATEMIQDPIRSAYGIGPALAARLEQQGISNISQLRTAIKNGTVSLSDSAERALKYYEDLQEAIPRVQMVAFETLLKQAFNKIPGHAGGNFAIAGSFRRGNLNSGDVDVLIHCKTRKTDADILDLYQAELVSAGLVLERLDHGSNKMTLLIALPGIPTARHLDVRVVPSISWAPALLYFTGSKDCNIRLRRKAISLGLKLSEWSLEDTSTHEALPVKTERDIFRALDLPYLEPENR